VQPDYYKRQQHYIQAFEKEAYKQQDTIKLCNMAASSNGKTVKAAGIARESSMMLKSAADAKQ
jgi:hypothetical protein